MTDSPDPIDVAVGARIRGRRRWRGLSQGIVAHQVGVTFQQLQKYERGANRVSASKLVALAAVLETTVANLVGEDGAERQDPEVAEAVAVLALPGARDLMAAFRGIRDLEARRGLVAIARQLARPGPFPTERDAEEALAEFVAAQPGGGAN